MKKYAFLLGREPDLSLRELESVFGEVERRGEFALISRDELSLSELDRLGGTIKVGELVASEVSR